MAGDLARALEDADGVGVARYDSRADAVDAVEEGRVAAAVLVPADYDVRLLSVPTSPWITSPGPTEAPSRSA